MISDEEENKCRLCKMETIEPEGTYCVKCLRYMCAKEAEHLDRMARSFAAIQKSVDDMPPYTEEELRRAPRSVIIGLGQRYRESWELAKKFFGLDK